MSGSGGSVSNRGVVSDGEKVDAELDANGGEADMSGSERLASDDGAIVVATRPSTLTVPSRGDGRATGRHPETG